MKKVFVGLLVAIMACTFSLSSIPARAEGMTLSQLVELFISLGIIGPDKAAAARAAVASSGDITDPHLEASIVGTPSISLQGGQGTSTITAAFNVTLRAVDGDFSIEKPSLVPFMAYVYRNGVKTEMTAYPASFTSFTTPSSGVLDSGLPSNISFKLAKNNTIGLPIIFSFVPTGSFATYSVSLEGVRFISSDGQLAATSAIKGFPTPSVMTQGVEGYVPPTAKPSITLLSPNGGETLEIGKAYQISWKTSDVPADTKLNIGLVNEAGGTIDELFLSTANDGSEIWTVNAKTRYGFEVKPGKYKISIYCPSQTEVCPTGAMNDTSDSFFNLATGSTLGYHNADLNRDWKIDESELAKVTDLYNYRTTTADGSIRTGEYHILNSSYDGYGLVNTYAPGPGSRGGSNHSADTNKDWKIDVSELSRVVTLKNGTGYKIQTGTVDGFAPISATQTSNRRSLACGSRGDLNGDGYIDRADYDALGSVVVGNVTSTLALADINGDGNISTTDWVALGRYVNNLDSTMAGCSVTTVPANSLITVISPNGGETYSVTDSISIGWQQGGTVRSPYLYVINSSGSSMYSRPLGGHEGKNTETLDFRAVKAAGQYKIKVCDGISGFCDMSDSYFTLGNSSTAATGTVPTMSPTVTVVSPNGGQTYSLSSPYSIIEFRARASHVDANARGTFSLYVVKTNRDTETSAGAKFLGEEYNLYPISGDPTSSDTAYVNNFAAGTYYVYAVWKDSLGNRAVDYSDSYITITPAVSVSTCTDSDGGVNINVAGLTDGRVNGLGSYFNDSSVGSNGGQCSGDNCTSVAEGYCDNGVVTNYLYSCPSGYSVNGACASKPTVIPTVPTVAASTCTDSDGGKNPDVAGLADGRMNGLGSYFNDSSVGSNGGQCSGDSCTSVAEGYCDNGVVTNTLMSCSTGYSVNGACATKPVVVTPPAITKYHSADTNHDGKIDDSELARFQELYNYRAGTVRTGEYHTSSGSVDGYDAGPGDQSGAPHSADTNGDWKISLTELLRVIELKNASNGYKAQDGTEDGFAPVALASSQTAASFISTDSVLKFIKALVGGR